MFNHHYYKEQNGTSYKKTFAKDLGAKFASGLCDRFEKRNMQDFMAFVRGVAVESNRDVRNRKVG